MRRRRLITRLVLTGLAAVAAVVILRGGEGRTVRAEFSSAINLVSGAEVRAGGVKVGTVRSIDLRDGVADVELGIEDDDLWPLREGTRSGIRLGGTVSYANRYVELEPGPGTGRRLEEGDRIPARDTTAPVEFDQLFDTFDARTRDGLGELVDEGRATFARRGEVLAEGLDAAPAPLAQAAATFDGLSDDPYALQTLLRAGGDIANQLAERERELQDLVTGTSRTLTATAEARGDLERTIDRLPAALRAARGTLGRVDGSLRGVDRLVGDLAPGARELRRVAPPLRRAVGTLRGVAPQLDATLERLRSHGPAIAALLEDAVPQARRLRPVLERLSPMLACVRVYAPEAAGFLSTWAAFNTGYDRTGRYAWLNGQVLPFPNMSPLTSAQVVSLFPQLQYGLVRPPGRNVGQPSLVPECGVTAERQQARNDPEARG